ncbi:TetR/AcrR family transcriptional regulator [Dyadobacter psychrotolerans]|uniref:TetR/AcrR family transcriptional regulator n=1 Tax=Dyadobacter psychrotolerans TaxID=2541721 RepID=A0A4V2Z336_9BACT|nr:TetR/AcrR family transcriptional regulator [Dyadobacter psychrotolerans]TDE11248.1 TetR/AcrR family transcriptional regulator [Dyadobacter psychrotolerans]
MGYLKVEDDIVIEKLLEIFRSVGYDGASISGLAAAIGLKKASLYHRFPEGKEAMAHAVLAYIGNWNESQVIEVLMSSKPAKERLEVVLDSINSLYNGGRLACILRALSHGTAAELFKDEIAIIFQTWISAFTHLANNLGHEPEKSKKLAESTLVRIQGSLILAQTLQDPSIFQMALGDIKADFLK